MNVAHNRVCAGSVCAAVCVCGAQQRRQPGLLAGCSGGLLGLWTWGAVRGRVRPWVPGALGVLGPSESVLL